VRSSIAGFSISLVYLSLSIDKTEEVRRLGMGRLLSDVSRKMHSRVVGGEDEEDREKAPKILVHSTHDTALAALCSTLDVYDDKLGILSRLL
jgi:acid phosphatase